MKNSLSDLALRNWKALGAPYEPVGLSVLVLTEDHQIFKAYRKKPCQSKGEKLEYIRECDGQPVEKAIGWDII